MYDLVDDTIVAVSSPVGEAARGIVRMSGPDTIRIADELFHAEDGSALRGRESHRRVRGTLEIERDQPRVPAIVYLFKAPTSYTRQDLVEFHLPGSPLVLNLAVQRLLEAGARGAQPGEFTARAFVSGRLDLTEAEGVAAVIAARSDAQLAAANRLMHGAVSQRVLALGERLADLLSLVEADIDFSEEEITFITAEELAAQTSGLRAELRQIREQAISTEQLAVMPTVALVGPPNVGKSSLLNALSGVDRAICSPVPGTTRDMLSAPLELRRCETMLVDAAGLGRTDTALDRQAHALACKIASEADVLVFVVDLAAEPPAPQFELLAGLPERRGTVVYVANKVDLLTREEIGVRCEGLRVQRGELIWPVSAVTGAGLDRLRGLIESKLDAPEVDRGRELLALNARHRRAIEEAEAALQRAEAMCVANPDIFGSVEILACELREAADQLAVITGAVHPEDLLSRVFGRFCIGK
jgi:tRNA modification GTPase